MKTHGFFLYSESYSVDARLFASQVSDLSLPAQQFVTNLYEGFLQRGPDAGGLSFWTGQAGTTAQSRQNVLNAFATCGPFRELSGALYRETFWLVADQLGTPRMIADRTGSLAGIRRHDYLPFSEEVAGDATWRTAGRGYRDDSVRQKFTGYERDTQTWLDYAQARYFAVTQGRFTSPDPMLESSDPEIAQSWNRYTYVLNNPLVFVDETGLVWGYRDYTNKDGQKMREFAWFEGDTVGEGYTLFTDPAYRFGVGRAV